MTTLTTNESYIVKEFFISDEEHERLEKDGKVTININNMSHITVKDGVIIETNAAIYKVDQRLDLVHRPGKMKRLF